MAGSPWAALRRCLTSCTSGADDGAQRALVADVPREGACVDAGHGEDAVLGQPVEPRLSRRAVEAVVGELPGDDRPGVRLAGLVAVGVRAVVAVHRERVGDELAAVGGIGGDLLIAGHAGVEDDLAAHRPGTGERLAGEGDAVLEDDDGRARQGHPRRRARRRP